MRGGERKRYDRSGKRLQAGDTSCSRFELDLVRVLSEFRYIVIESRAETRFEIVQSMRARFDVSSRRSKSETH